MLPTWWPNASPVCSQWIAESMRPSAISRRVLRTSKRHSALVSCIVHEQQVESLIAPLELPVAEFAPGTQLDFAQTVRVTIQTFANGFAGKRCQRLSEPASSRFLFRGELFERRFGSCRLKPLMTTRSRSNTRWPDGRRSRRCRESGRGDPAAACT